MYITDETIEKFIKEDIPYIDLSTLITDIDKKRGFIRFTAREDAVLCGTEEVIRIFDKLNIDTVSHLPSGTKVKPNDILIEGRGRAGKLHMAWKISLNVLEYCSGIATRTKKLVDKAKSINPKVEVVTTRKVFPGTKELAIKAVISGRGYPHRLGLSETILIFKQHTNFMGGLDALVERIDTIRSRACEKKVIIEVECIEDAIKIAAAGVDGIQFDKLSPEALKEAVSQVRSISPHITLIGTGGITESNISQYVESGIDAIATTSVYFGKPVDIGAVLDIVEI